MLPVIDARLWAAWIAFVGFAFMVSVTWFAVMETIAVKNKYAGDTLTEVTRTLNLPMALWLIGGWALVGITIGFVIWWPVHLKLHW
jgi:hypothetical protein